MSIRTARSPRARVWPTPAPKVVPAATLAIITGLAAGACTMAALWSLHELVENPPGWLGVAFVVGSAAAFLPLIPAVRAAAFARRRAVLQAAGNLPDARIAAASGRDKATVAISYSVAVLLCAAVIWFVSANDGAVAETFLRVEYIQEFWWEVAKAFWVNIRIAVGAEILILVFGLLFAIMRLLPGPAWRPVRGLAIVYIDAFRALPGIIVLYLVGFGLPLANVPILQNLSPMWLAIAALTLSYSAYTAEAYRAGIESIHPSQWSAARSLGIPFGMTLSTVIVPQAFRRIIPVLMSNFIGLQKDTALVGVMGVVDAFLQSQIIAGNIFNLTPVVIVSILFVLITVPQTRAVDILIARDQARQARGAS